jgi:PAS domain S-box-containing protein
MTGSGLETHRAVVEPPGYAVGSMASGEQTRSKLGPYVAKTLVVSGAYFVTAKLGLQLAFAHASITAVWPPTGISLAALVIWGYRMWPGVAIGAALANTFTGDAPGIAIPGITIGNTLEALVGAYLLREVAHFKPSLERVRDVLALVLLAGVLSTMVSATIGVTSLWIGGEIDSVGDLSSAWRVWWLGDMGGDLLVAPFLLVLARGARMDLEWAKVAEGGAVLCLLVGLSLLIFSQDVPYTYLIFPPLIWAAFRFRQLGATFSSLIVATIAVLFTENDLGPFARGSPDNSLLLSQTFMGVAGATALLLAAITSERRQAEAGLRRAHDSLEARVKERTAELDRSRERFREVVEAAPDAMVIVKEDGEIVLVNAQAERVFGYAREELIGRQIEILVPERLREAHYSYRGGFLSDPHARPMGAGLDLHGRRKDGAEFPVEISLSPLPTEEGMLVSSAIRDITERKRADVLERSFVPERLPEIPGVRLAARFIPGGTGVEVGGDWYDVLEIGDGSIGLAIGDVAGRGVQAAAVMAQLRNALRAYVFESHSPAIALERLNGLAWTLDGVMATLIYLSFDPGSGRMRFANAGHLPPLRAKPDGSTLFLEEGRSPPLGARAATSYKEAEYVLEPGSTLILYTDGLVEKRFTVIDDRLALLAQCAGTEQDGLEALCDHLLARVAPSGEDDVALLAIQPVQLDPQELRLRLPADPAALRSLRNSLRRWLAQCEASDRESGEIVLACNEAVANSIEHAYGPSDGSVEVVAGFTDGAVRIVVRDDGKWRAPRGDNRGRGLNLMKALMDSVRVETRGGTDVRMVRQLERSRD